MALVPAAPQGRRRAAKDLPPLIIAAVACLALLAVLPSALNLPQTNPSQTLEYAPVPPEDESVTPPAGNFSSLGLGSSASVGQGPGEGGPGGGGGGGGEVVGGRAVKTPSTKRCVGNPPRQTEDVSSPPCVASFTGDNGGATYQGVTGEEVRILLHVDGNYNDVGSRGMQGRPNGEVFDIAKPLPEEDNKGIYWLQAAQIWQRYFNERFQTYGRFAHLYVSFGTGQTPEMRKSDAVNDYTRVKPFAVIVQDAPYQSSVPYVEVMASKGVLAFGIRSQLPEQLFRKSAGKLWTYWPSIQMQSSSSLTTSAPRSSRSRRVSPATTVRRTSGCTTDNPGASGCCSSTQRTRRRRSNSPCSRRKASPSAAATSSRRGPFPAPDSSAATLETTRQPPKTWRASDPTA